MAFLSAILINEESDFEYADYAPPIDASFVDGDVQLITSADIIIGLAIPQAEIIWWSECACECPEPEPEETIADGEPPSLIPCREMPLVMYRERTAKWDFAIDLNGVVLDITPHNIRFTAKWDKYDDDTDAVFSVAVGSGITKTSPTEGELQVEIEPGLTTSLPRHNVDLYYDLQIQDPNTEEVYTVRSGTLIVYATVSLTVP